jgi:hypothetical protein
MTHQKSQELKAYLDQRFDGIDQRFDGIDQRLDRIDQRLDGVDGRLGCIDGRLDGMDRRFDGIDGRLDGLDGRLGGLDGRLGGIDQHLDRQDIDFNNTTMNLLRTIEAEGVKSRHYADRLFGILDRPALHADDAPKAVKPRGSKRPGRTAAR